MKIQEQATQTKQDRDKHRECYNLISRNFLQLLSSLLLPLILGVFTLVITFEQQRIAREQWLADKNESRLQREHEMKIAYEQQETQRQISQDQYRDELLAAYIKEIGDLLKDNNGSLISNRLIHILVRAKTLNAIRQLDGVRQAHVIRFLYEAEQLQCACKSHTIDISTAELINTNFYKLSTILKEGGLSLAGAYFQNCTLDDLKVRGVDFSRALLNNINFLSAELLLVNFSSAKFDDVNFSSANLNTVYFSSAVLNSVNFSSTLLGNIIFWAAQLNNINFPSAKLYYVHFSLTSLFNVNFSFAELYNVNFSSNYFLNVNFSSSRLYNVNFSSASLESVTFSSALLENVTFSSVRLINGRFSFTTFNVSNVAPDFYLANVLYTEFTSCVCDMINFVNVNLIGSSFRNTSLQGAYFSGANLWNADFTNTNITDEQLHSALSIRSAKLPNGTLGQGKNLIKNGDANCKISLTDHWHVLHGNIEILTSPDNRNDCQFTLQSDASSAIMVQQITLTKVWDHSIWPNSTIELQARMAVGVSIKLNGIDDYGTIIDTIKSSESRIWMPLKTNMKQIQLMIEFNSRASSNRSKMIWCDDIELFIDYNRY